jgi:tetratricopeptide (TPR) repeat protein
LPSENYTFFDLLQLKTLRDLTAKRVRAAVIFQSLQNMRMAAGMENPLLEAGVFPTGNRVAFRHDGTTVEPIAGQFVMEFENRELRVVGENVRPMRSPETVAELFAKGVALEEDPTTQAEAMACYMKVIDLEPAHAAAFINLGTLHYNRQDFTQAENFYRKAIAADARYALAYFDLGNVLDETGRLAEAVEAYKTAITIAPTYADAHYNLALAYEKLRQPRKALAHWRAYIKLDSVGPWATHARGQMQRILKDEKLMIVARRTAK